MLRAFAPGVCGWVAAFVLGLLGHHTADRKMYHLWQTDQQHSAAFKLIKKLKHQLLLVLGLFSLLLTLPWPPLSPSPRDDITHGPCGRRLLGVDQQYSYMMLLQLPLIHSTSTLLQVCRINPESVISVIIRSPTGFTHKSSQVLKATVILPHTHTFIYS